MTAVEPTTTPETRSRREVLCGLMVALVAPGALVAACADSAGTPSNSSGTATSGAGGSSSAAGSAIVAALADIPQGGGKVITGTPKGSLVVVRPTADTVRAFDAACPHQGNPVGAPSNGTITCPKHGSTFDGATGALKGGPAKTGLKEVAVKIEGDKVVLA